MTTVDALGSGWSDVLAALRKSHLVSTLSGHDVATRYKRSSLGAFWITVAMAISIGSIGLVFGWLFRAPVTQFLPYFATGSIVWTFIATCLNEGCAAFVASSGIILQVRIPLFVHVLRTLVRDTIVLAHNIVLIPLVFAVCGYPIRVVALLAIPGFLLLLINLGWMSLVLSTVCARYRDITQMVHSAVGVLYFLTPVMWKADALPGPEQQVMIHGNPFYHLLSVVRSPLLGDPPDPLSWAVSIVLAMAGWTLALIVFGRFRTRVAYWL